MKVKPGQIIEPGAALVEITDTRKRQHHQTAALGKDAVFDALDLDGSGELSREELVEVMVGWGGESAFSALVFCRLMRSRILFAVAFQTSQPTRTQNP